MPGEAKTTILTLTPLIGKLGRPQREAGLAGGRKPRGNGYSLVWTPRRRGRMVYNQKLAVALASAVIAAWACPALVPRTSAMHGARSWQGSMAKGGQRSAFNLDR